MVRRLQGCQVRLRSTQHAPEPLQALPAATFGPAQLSSGCVATKFEPVSLEPTADYRSGCLRAPP